MELFRIMFFAIGLVAFSSSAFAQADKLRDLVGSRAAGAETEMESRGYESTTGGRSDATASWSYWWGSNVKHCVVVMTENGRIKAITDTVPQDCGKKKGMSTGSKIAIAVGLAAAAISVAAIAHKAHDHDDGKHWEDHRWEADYDRGYRDGLHNHSFDNWSSDQYRSGYKAGAKQRRNETPWWRN